MNILKTCVNIVCSEGSKERKSGLAYEVILKPASAETTPLKPQTPPKDKNLTQDDILKKLQKAQERREVVRPRVASIYFL